MKIKHLIKSLGTTVNYPGLTDFEVGGITCDSKKVKENFIFVAIKGRRQDGNKFIDEAIAKGAKAVIAQGTRRRAQGRDKIPFIKVKDARKALARLAAGFYGNPSGKIKVVGVTGTNGKTTVTYLIEAIIREAGFGPSVIGTINYRFKDKVIPSKNTTPGPIELQSMLSDMLKEGIDYCIMEVSSHALDQDRVEGINFSSAIFTNLTQDHLDYHMTFKDYFNAKSKLFKNLDSNSFAVINNDDNYAARIKKITRAKVITYGLNIKADIMARDLRFDSSHTEFKLLAPGETVEFSTPLIGRHNVYNILAAASFAQSSGIEMPVIKSAVEKFSRVPGRLERVFDGKFSVFVDYAHTQDALSNILQALRPLSKKKIIVVFGCGGERDRTKRPKMGRTVSELADYAIITNDNPRSEGPEAIINEIRRGIRRNNYCVMPDRAEAIKKSLHLAKRGDIVLVAGKGHEDYQIIQDKRIHFDDREAVKRCLKSMNC